LADSPKVITAKKPTRRTAGLVARKARIAATRSARSSTEA
jgi:hypothetical protein